MSNEMAVSAFILALKSFDKYKSLVDFTIVCEGREYRVHRVVLALNSPVLSRAVSGDFEEARSGRLDLSADGEPYVRALLDYCYLLQYPFSPVQMLSLTDSMRAECNVQMCILADKYDIQPLKRMAIEAFKHVLQWPHVDDLELARAAKVAYGAVTSVCNAMLEILLAGAVARV